MAVNDKMKSSKLQKDKLKQLARELDDYSERFPKVAQDNLFIAWFLRAYLTEKDDAAIEAVTGGPRDKGVDAVLIDSGARVVYVVQAKYRTVRFGKAEARGSVIDFATIAQRLYEPDDEGFAEFLYKMDETTAAMLRDARKRLRGDYRLVLIFVTLGKCTATLIKDARSAARRASHDCTIEVIDGFRCLILLQDYLDGAAPPIPTLYIPVESGEGVRVNSVLQRYDRENSLESWVFSAKGHEIAHMFEMGGRRLFARNIRGFLGDKTPVNDSMVKTLQTQPDYFYYYNNGITIVCDEAEKVSHRGTDVLRVSNPQVINGQQTSRVLAESPQSKHASVLVKVIRVPRDPLKMDGEFDNLVGRIVQATNWQNAIRPSDLMANDRRQLVIEKSLRGQGYYYARKRQTKGEIRAQMRGKKYVVISKEELAQAVAGCELDPVVARSGKDNLFVEDKYQDVFPSTSADYFLPRYWLFKEVTRGARGYPQRGYTKWMVLGFIWSEVASFFRSAKAARRFSGMCLKGDQRLVRPLGRAVDLVYSEALRYYRANRGKGDMEQDVSLFFRSKKGRNREFVSFWGRLPKKKRATFSANLVRVREQLTTEE